MIPAMFTVKPANDTEEFLLALFLQPYYEANQARKQAIDRLLTRMSHDTELAV